MLELTMGIFGNWGYECTILSLHAPTKDTNKKTDKMIREASF